MDTKFSGNQEHRDYLLFGFDNGLRNLLLPRVPAWLGTQALTCVTLLWCGLAIIVGFAARHNLAYLFFLAGLVFAQHVTDVLDGAVGRKNNTGLIRWGFYMDHFLDYCFMSCLVVAHALLMPANRVIVMLLVQIVLTAVTVSILLVATVTGEFARSYKGVGITEQKAIFVIFNVLVVFLGVHFMVVSYVWFISAAAAVIPYFVFKEQRKLKALDLQNRQ